MSRKPTEYNQDRAADYRVMGRIDQMGKSRIKIECPFCKITFWAYIWSLCGGGKKCPDCGSLHNGTGTAVPVKRKTE